MSTDSAPSATAAAAAAGPLGSAPAPSAGGSGDAAVPWLYALVVGIWGTSWIGLRLQVESGVPILVSVAYRFLLAAVILLVWCWLRRIPLRQDLAAHRRIAAQGVVLFAVNYLLFYAAAAHVTSGLLAVAFSTVTVFTNLLGVLVLGNPPQPRVIAAAAIGLGGIAMVYWPEVGGLAGGAAGGEESGLTGLLLALGGTLSAAVGLTLSAANQRRGLPVVQTNAWGMLYGGLAVGLAAAVAGLPFTFAWTPAYLGSLAFLVLPSSVIAFGAYLTLVGRIGPERASYASILFPVVALMVSTLVEGYQWTPLAVGGVALVLVGNVLVLVRPSRRRRV